MDHLVIHQEDHDLAPILASINPDTWKEQSARYAEENGWVPLSDDDLPYLGPEMAQALKEVDMANPTAREVAQSLSDLPAVHCYFWWSVVGFVHRHLFHQALQEFDFVNEEQDIALGLTLIDKYDAVESFRQELLADDIEH